ncbi:MAG: hypothetical protein KDB09_09350 [Acidimicrobiales bacterium]|nr:hypothetical protein [Acidimicrobiales bacterium]
MRRIITVRVALTLACIAAILVIIRRLRGPAAPVFTTPAPSPALLALTTPTSDSSATTQQSRSAIPTPPTGQAAGEERDEDKDEDDRPTSASDVPAEPAPHGERWVFADQDGECPLSHPIKAKLRSGLYHEPGMVAYQRTNPDRCYATRVDAEADGLRRAKR